MPDIKINLRSTTPDFKDEKVKLLEENTGENLNKSEIDKAY